MVYKRLITFCSFPTPPFPFLFDSSRPCESNHTQPLLLFTPFPEWPKGFRCKMENVYTQNLLNNSSSVRFLSFYQLQSLMWPNLRMYLLFLATIPSCSFGYQVLHLADFHLDVDYSIHGNKEKMCHDDGQQRNETLGQYGDYLCDAPKVRFVPLRVINHSVQPLVQHAIDEAARLFPNPDLIIWTGDNVAHVEGYGWECEWLSRIIIVRYLFSGSRRGQSNHLAPFLQVNFRFLFPFAKTICHSLLL